MAKASSSRPRRSSVRALSDPSTTERLLRDARRLTREQPQLLAWVVDQWSKSTASASSGQRTAHRKGGAELPLPRLDAIAVLVATLGESAAAVAFRHLTRASLIEVGLSIHRLSVISRVRQREVLLDYLDVAKHYVVLVDDPQAFLQASLEGALGEVQANHLQAAIAARKAQTLTELLQSLSLDVIGKFIRQEPRQVAAAVLGQLDATRAAALCRLLEEPLSRDLGAHLGATHRLTPAALQQLHEGLVRALTTSEEMEGSPGTGRGAG